jgi:hypothetical protein
MNKDLEDANFGVVAETEIEIPRNLTINQEDMKQRKYFDLRRWYCIARP